MRNEKLHSRLSWLDESSKDLTIGGMTLHELAERAGTTPFYVYDRGLIAQRVRELRTTLPQAVKIHYAIKANPQLAVVQYLASLVDGFDVASHGELRIALDTGIDPKDIGFAGPGKSIPELRAAVCAGVQISIESELELERVSEISKTLNRIALIAIRVNPEFELKRSGAKMGGQASPFGIDAGEVPRLVAKAREKGLDVAGLHIYAGSQNLDAASIIEANRLTFELAVELIDNCKLSLRTVNIGGGYGIPYFENEQALDLPKIGASLDALLQEHEESLKSANITVELGRYIVGEAGYYVTRVTDLKTSQGKSFAVVDGGLHHHLANSGNFGQVIRKNYPVVIGNKLAQPINSNPISVVGPLCTPLDIVAHSVQLPTVEIGDFVVVLQSGAYACSASPHQFLGHDRPVEMLAGQR